MTAGFWRTARLVTAVLVLITASYYAVVAFDNITNPSSNWVFVKGVTGMDGVPPDSRFGWRALAEGPFQVALYVAIIGGEVLTAVLMAIGGIGGMRRSWKHEPWLGTQRWSLAGCGLGLLIFFLGFIVLGGNWWVMYLNDKWNGLDAAFQNSVLTALTLIVVLAVAIGGKEGSNSADDN